MRKKLVSLLFICSLFPILTTAESPKTRTHLPTNSVAISDDALATFFNPAGLGTRRALNLYYLRTYNSEWSGDDALFIAAPGTGFSMEFVNAANDIDFARYTFSTGWHFGNAMYFGSNYSWINSDNRDYDRYKSLSVGLMYRRRYFSIGAIGRDLNRPKILNQKLGRTYDIGVALRPGTWRTTFSVDMRKTQDIKEIDLSYAVEIRPIRELMLRGTYNSDQTFDVRFGINLGNFGIGTANYFDENSKANTGIGYFNFSTAAITKPISRRRTFLNLEMHQLNSNLQIVKWDKDVAGILIQINGSKFGIAKCQEIRDAIMELKEAGKIVICYITGCSTADYIVASACDRILMHPIAEMRLIGLRSEQPFYKGALDKLGITAHLEHIGDYKSASESFTRTNMSEQHQENLNAILDDLYEQLTTDIAIARGWTPQSAKQMIDQGPFTATQAIRTKIVDELLYPDELTGIVNRLSKSKVNFIDIKEYLKSGLYPHNWTVPIPKIAIIEAEGMMLADESFTDPFTGTKIMGARTIARAIQQTQQDTSINAVVLRINSVGGLVSVADTIWNELVKLKAAKPLIVSMADIAASGGYYIAAPADVIVAEPGTITGSIGVIGGKYSFKGLYDKIGIKKETIKRGENADFYSNYSDYTPQQQQILKKQINETYNDFVAKVARGRTQLTVKDVDKVAQGRVWTGRQAKEKGLVDELGGLSKALSIARKRAGLENKTVEIVRLPKSSWISQFVGNVRLISTARMPLLSNMYQTLGQSASLKLINIIKRHNIFLLMPYEIKVGS